MKIDFAGYAGNGIVELADATASDTFIGQLEAITQNVISDPAESVPLSAIAVQNLVAKSNYLGVNMRRNPSSAGDFLGFAGLGNLNATPPPALNIEYSIPEASTIASCGFALVSLLRRRRENLHT